MVRLRLEVTVEPFVPGHPGPHVQAAVAAMGAAGLVPELGPFATVAEGSVESITSIVGDICSAALDAGASGLNISIRQCDELTDAQQEFLDAFGPVAKALRATVVALDRVRPDDVPLVLQGRVVGGLRLPEQQGDLQGALERLIKDVEAELGGSLRDLSREDKQRAAMLLEERGAFHLRNAVEDLADAMGVSRVTVYNYLNALRSSGPRDA
jgi:uncharacterized protein YqgV (UPF0045/DUF77 family)